MFNLPESTKINKVLPKNSFHKYASACQKKALTDKVEKIIWEHKLARETINLEGGEIEEIQIFNIQLKDKDSVEDILKLIDRSIPYHIIHVLSFNQWHRISISKKHIHPTNEDLAVIDWTFTTEWTKGEVPELNFTLKKSLDYIVVDICFQISGKEKNSEQSIETLIEKEQQLKYLNTQIEKLQSEITKCKQFNKKVELNLNLNELIELKENLNKTK